MTTIQLCDPFFLTKGRKARSQSFTLLLCLFVCSASCYITSSGVRTSYRARNQMKSQEIVQSSSWTAERNDDQINIINVGRWSNCRMTHERQQECLRKTVEMRRITKVKSELSLQSGSSPFTVAVAKAAGYGDEIDLLEKAIMEGEAARDALITENMGLVYFCVKDIMSRRKNQFRLQSLSMEDLVQEGSIGLARAIDRWNMEIGGKFSTYAVYWIRAAVLRGIAERDDFVRVPEHVSAAVRKVSRAAQTLGLNIDDDTALSPLWKEAKAAKALAEAAGITDRQLVEAMKVRERRKSGIISYEAWMQGNRQYENDLVPLETLSTDDGTTSSPETASHLKSVLGKYLRPKEIEALSWRYGLNVEEPRNKAKSQPNRYLQKAEHALFPNDLVTPRLPVRGKWGEAMSFSEVGIKMQVSAEYGRKLCHAALFKLQRAAEEGKIELALLFS